MSTQKAGGKEEAARAGVGATEEEEEASGHPPEAEAGMAGAATRDIKQRRAEAALSRRLLQSEPLLLLDIR